MPTPIALASVARVPSLCCCFGKCCQCLNLSFLKTAEGVVKILEVILSGICQNLLISYSGIHSLTLGSSYYSLLTTCSASLMTSFILILCYVISSQNVHSLRSSLFETLFNAFACMSYFSTSCYLAFAVHTYLYPLYKVGSVFTSIAAMDFIYGAGFAASLVHGYDAYLAYNT